MSDTTTTPTNSDPQDLINAALGTTTPTTPTPTLPTEPTTPAPEPMTMPSELTEAPPLPTPEVKVEQVVEQVSTGVAMGDDTPLAFVGTTPTPSTTTESVTEPTMPVSLGTSAPMDAVPPVVPVSTLPIEPTKPRNK